MVGVAGLAVHRQRLVAAELDPLGHLDQPVALLALERLVLALELVAAVLLVVEAELLLPAGRLVAAGAVGDPLDRQLPGVDVGVAAGAGDRQRLVADHAGVPGLVAGGAGGLLVLAGEREAAVLGVVEAGLLEGLHHVAAGAALLVEARLELPGVGIAVAGAAVLGGARQVEQGQARLDRPLAGLQLGPHRGRHLGLQPGVLGVAAGAGHHLVGPLQLVGQLLVVLQLVPDRHPGLQRVAAVAGLDGRGGRRWGLGPGLADLPGERLGHPGAGRRRAGQQRLGQLAEVRVEVAVGALAERDPAVDRGLARVGAVAGLAAHLQVGAAQRVAGLVVEDLLLGRAVHRLPVRGGVARLAGLPEAPLVRVLLVAVEALLERDGLVERLQGRSDRRHLGAGVAERRRGRVGVALQAGHLEVLSVELVGGRLVLEGGRLPGDQPVALGAVLARLAELAAVLVHVAGHAGGGGAELAGPALLQHRPHAGVGDEAGVVALGAVGLGVLALQHVAGLLVVEALLARSAPVHELEVAPLVLVVALLAGPLLGLHPAVEAAVLHQRGVELLVALQAVVLRELLARLVALGAVGQPLQRGVRPGQRAGGEDVGARRRGGAGQGQQRRGGQGAGARTVEAGAAHRGP